MQHQYLDFIARSLYMFRVLSVSIIRSTINLLLMMGTESTRNTYSDLAKNSRYSVASCWTLCVYIYSHYFVKDDVIIIILTAPIFSRPMYSLSIRLITHPHGTADLCLHWNLVSRRGPSHSPPPFHPYVTPTTPSFSEVKLLPY
jgi:hypothetical protein